MEKKENKQKEKNKKERLDKWKEKDEFAKKKADKKLVKQVVDRTEQSVSLLKISTPIRMISLQFQRLYNCFDTGNTTQDTSELYCECCECLGTYQKDVKV